MKRSWHDPASCLSNLFPTLVLSSPDLTNNPPSLGTVQSQVHSKSVKAKCLYPWWHTQPANDMENLFSVSYDNV